MPGRAEAGWGPVRPGSDLAGTISRRRRGGRPALGGGPEPAGKRAVLYVKWPTGGVLRRQRR